MSVKVKNNNGSEDTSWSDCTHAVQPAMNDVHVILRLMRVLLLGGGGGVLGITLFLPLSNYGGH